VSEFLDLLLGIRSLPDTDEFVEDVRARYQRRD